MSSNTQTAGGVLNAALTEMKAPLTKENPVNIETWATEFNFQTFGESVLKSMVEASARFILAVRAKETPRWLTFTGSSGAGKTYLARKIFRKINSEGHFQTINSGGDIVFPTDWVYWPKAAQDLQSQIETDEVYDAPRTQFLVIDEMGGIRDSTGYVSNRLAVILGQRDKKWTVITSNLTLDQIGDRLDTRIASRLIRGQNKLVQVSTVDFALR